jgi:hypothetical protein
MYTNILNEDNADIIEVKASNFDSNVLSEVKKQAQASISSKRSVIINCHEIINISPDGVTWFNEFHNDAYNNYNLSFVICNAANINKYISEDDYLNITPTLAEALDIVNMEVIERELLG